MNRLQQFQERYRLVPDGVIGPKTLRMMKQVFCIRNNERLAHFVGQIVHETANFKYEIENLNYSASALRRVFRKYFPPEIDINEYANDPVKIGSRVYANRMGNGDEASKEGYKYRGRGPLMITGKKNYSLLERFTGNNCLVSNPNIVLTSYYFESALFFFEENHLWHLCDRVDNDSIILLSKRINGGTNGLKDRLEQTYKFYRMLK